MSNYPNYFEDFNDDDWKALELDHRAKPSSNVQEGNLMDEVDNGKKENVIFIGCMNLIKIYFFSFLIFEKLR